MYNLWLLANPTLLRIKKTKKGEKHGKADKRQIVEDIESKLRSLNFIFSKTESSKNFDKEMSKEDNASNGFQERERETVIKPQMAHYLDSSALTNTPTIYE